MKALILFLLLTFHLFSKTIVTENDPATLVEGLVSVLTGDLYLAEEDIAIEGAEPLHLKRHFITNSWNISFFQNLSAYYFPKNKGIAIYEANGSQLLFIKPDHKQDFELLSYHHLPGVSNTSRGRISAVSNLKNQRIRFSDDTFSLLLPNGTARHYRKTEWQDFSDRVRYSLDCEELISSLGQLQHEIDPLGRKYSTSCPYYAQQVLKFDAVGNILSMQLPEEIIEYRYDDLYQLTEETGLFAHTYSYDSHFNRTRKDDQAYLINSLNQNLACAYDPNGNPLSYGLWCMTYDAFDRLIRIEDPKQRLTFTYDADHRRLSKHIYTKQNGQWTLKQHVNFLYDGQNEIGSTNAQNKLQELRILGRTPHAESGSAVAVELKGELYAPIHDLQGNLCTLVPVKDPQKTERYRYSAFGEEQASRTFCPWRFSSKRIDESGLVYYGRRYYCPTLGRWLTPDPLGLSAGINLYAFVSNDPLIKVDDYGLMEAYWDYYASQRIQDPKHTFSGAVYGVKDFIVDTATFAGTIGWGLSLPFYYAPRWALGYSSVANDWRHFQASNQELHRMTERWMQRYLPADVNNTTFQTTRYGSRMACEVSTACVSGVGLVKTAYTAGKLGCNAVRLANNSKWIQQSLNECSRDLKNAKNLSATNSLTREKIKSYLNDVVTLNKQQTIYDLESIGLKIKGRSPDGRFIEFQDRMGNVRVKLHPPDKITNYNHMHIYNKKGNSLNKSLEIVDGRMVEAHIQIGDN